VLVDELDQGRGDHRLRQRVEHVDEIQRRAGYLGHDPPSFCDPPADDRQIDGSDYARDVEPSTAPRMLTSRRTQPISRSSPSNGSGAASASGSRSRYALRPMISAPSDSRCGVSHWMSNMTPPRSDRTETRCTRATL